MFQQGRLIHKLFLEKRIGCSFTNELLVFNLAAADLIMAVYLIILGINTEIYSGIYGKYNLTWRSSLTCNALGVLNVLSSETSVFTMVLLISIRLYSVYKV